MAISHIDQSTSFRLNYLVCIIGLDEAPMKRSTNINHHTIEDNNIAIVTALMQQ